MTSLLATIDTLNGNTTNASTINGSGQISLHTGLENNLAVTNSVGTALTKLGINAAAANTATRGSVATGAALTATTKLFSP